MQIMQYVVPNECVYLSLCNAITSHRPNPMDHDTSGRGHNEGRLVEQIAIFRYFFTANIQLQSGLIPPLSFWSELHIRYLRVLT
jgi:hypothetical protein